jgi:hypothetical protein
LFALFFILIISACTPVIHGVPETGQEKISREDIEAIYRGEAGQYGDLLRVTVQGGEMRIDGTHRHYEPVTFKIARSQIKNVEIVNTEDKHYTRAEELKVIYQDGTLLFDPDDLPLKETLRFVYDKDWIKGVTYKTINTEGRLKLRNAEIYIEIIPHLRH